MNDQKSYVEPSSLWRQWQFWLIIIAIVVVVLSAIYYMKRQAEGTEPPPRTNAVQTPR